MGLGRVEASLAVPELFSRGEGGRGAVGGKESGEELGTWMGIERKGRRKMEREGEGER